MTDLLRKIKEQETRKLPVHVAVIMDGNGRWAKQHGHERLFGHQQGVESVKRVIEGAGEAGIKYLTLYTFSTENWNRPKEEVDALMSLLVKAITVELPNLMEKRVRLLAIGDILSLPEECQIELANAINKTKENSGLSVVLALSYSARWEITEMVRKVSELIQKQKISPQEISEVDVSRNLSTAEIPDPDILIRTGGEFRISNFLLWQIAYTELFFLPLMWPDFEKHNLWEIILEYMTRERRFGKTGEQISSN
jgi:undecaprenyl diphosphate synthase